MKCQKFPINSNFVIQRWRNGVKLAEPQADQEQQTIECIFKADYSIYFLNTDSQNLLINEAGMEICGFNSLKDSFNKSIFDIASSYANAIKVANTHRSAMDLQQIRISEDYVQRKDGYQFQCITVCYPWYSSKNKIIGILGCSVISKARPLVDVLTEIINIGDFHIPIIQENLKDFSGLSKRERECIALIARGLTAKKIAVSLNLSPRTIEHYIDNIKNKLGVFSKHELIVNYLKAK